MALKESGLTGTDVQETCERQTGLLMQPPASMTQGRDGTTLTVIPTTVGAANDADILVEFGVPFVIHIGLSVGDAGGGAQTTQNRVFGTSGAPWKFRVLDTWMHMVDNDDTSMTLEIYHYTLDSDGALDSANSMTDTVTLAEGDDDLGDLGRVQDTSKLKNSYSVVDAGEEIVLRTITGNATQGSEYSVKLLCMRVN